MADLARYMADIRSRIAMRIKEQLKNFNTRYTDSGRWTSDVCERLTQYTTAGKMIRGILVMLAYQGYCDDDSRNGDSHILNGSAAIELLQSFMLIHDDIMDRDNTRRGIQSMHEQYASYAITSSASPMPAEDRSVDALHYGNSMAICCGDIAFAMANILMEQAVAEARTLSRDTTFDIIKRYNGEVIRVGIAQMDDITFSSAAIAHEPTPSDILSLYRNKTGYYSIVLPLILGALFANQQEEIPLLQEIGVRLGEVFQIRDDLLGLERESPEEHKSILSDIANGKKTYMRQLLIAQNNPTRLQKLREIESATLPKGALLSEYHALLSDAGILRTIFVHISTQEQEILAAIARLQRCNETTKERLRDFCLYNSQRTK